MLGGSQSYIQNKENKIIHRSINHLLPTLKVISA